MQRWPKAFVSWWQSPCPTLRPRCCHSQQRWGRKGGWGELSGCTPGARGLCVCVCVCVCRVCKCMYNMYLDATHTCTEQFTQARPRHFYLHQFIYATMFFVALAQVLIYQQPWKHFLHSFFYSAEAITCSNLDTSFPVYVRPRVNLCPLTHVCSVPCVANVWWEAEISCPRSHDSPGWYLTPPSSPGGPPPLIGQALPEKEQHILTTVESGHKKLCLQIPLHILWIWP